MKLGKGLRSAAAMVLSAATLLAMGALGVGTANATESPVALAGGNANGSIIIKNGKGHTFSLAKLAKYSSATSDSNTNLTGVSVESESTTMDTAVTTAITAAVPSVASSVDSDNPVGWIAKNWLGYTVTGSSDTTSSLSPTNSGSYSGNLRKFVTKFASTSSNDSLFGTTGTANETGTNDVTISGLPVGIYMLKDTSTNNPPTAGFNGSKSIPMLVGTTVGSFTTLGSTSEHGFGTVELKAVTPTITKVASALNGTNFTDDNDRDAKLPTAKIGDTVDFKITTTVPVTTDFTSFTYKITDKPTAGLVYDSTFTPTLSVSKSGSASISNGDLSLPSSPAAGTQFTFTFNNFTDQDKFPVGATITLTYRVKLTTVANVNWMMQNNDAELIYSNDQADSTKTATAKNATATKIALYSIQLHNTNKAGDTAIQGQFKVYKGSSTADADQLNFNTNGSLFIYNGTNGAQAAKQADSNGKIVFDGLPAGTYTIVQTSSADGYTKASFRVKIDKNIDGTSTNEFSIDQSDTVNSVTAISQDTTTPNTYNGLIDVKNINSLTQLPITGGVGVALVVLLALLSAGVVVVTSKIRRNNLVNARK